MDDDLMHRKEVEMSSPQDPKLLACSQCWESFFSTPEFQNLCCTPGEVEWFQYIAHVSRVEESAASGCNWCRLVLSLKDHAVELTSDEDRLPLRELTVEFGVGPQGESFTPQGNNRFSLWINGASYFLTAFTDKDDVTSNVVTAREIENQINTETAFNQTKKWLKNCGVVQPTQLPSRVIEVSPKNDPETPRLLESTAIIDHYVALSYCWGRKQTGLTNESNFKARQEFLDVSILSRTIQDAILVTRKLDFKYLWVDAICIIQDSREDKNVELAKMGMIYQNAFMTIVAASTASADQGFLKDRAPPTPSTKIPFWSPGGRLGTVSIRLEGWYNGDEEPINTRAWTLQERLLSSRLLIYASHTLQYQDNQGTVNLGDSINLPSGLAAWRIPSASARLNVQAAGRTWERIISMYSARRLSYLADKLNALAGVAEAFQKQNPVDYLAGLWSGDMLPRLLLWQASRTEDYTPCATYTAPSWSWASLSSPVNFSALYSHHSYELCDTHILKHKIILQSPKLPFGGVAYGHLKLFARIRRGIYQPPQYIRWEVLSTGSEPQKHLDSEVVISLDDDIFKERDIICLPIAIRSYDSDVKEDLPMTFGSAAKALFEPPVVEDGASWSVIDGLIIMASGTNKTYRRVGCFFGAKENEFQDCPYEEVTLI